MPPRMVARIGEMDQGQVSMGLSSLLRTYTTIPLRMATRFKTGYNLTTRKFMLFVFVLRIYVSY